MTIRQRLNRPKPKMPTHAYRTFAIRSPLSTHTRSATCQEVNCINFVNGWMVRKDSLTEQQLYAVRSSRRRYVETTVSVSETWLVFEPGQPCFNSTKHRIALGRPELYYTGRGDYRSFKAAKSAAITRDEWLDRFANHQDKLATLYKRG